MQLPHDLSLFKAQFNSNKKNTETKTDDSLVVHHLICMWEDIGLMSGTLARFKELKQQSWERLLLVTEIMEFALISPNSKSLMSNSVDMEVEGSSNLEKAGLISSSGRNTMILPCLLIHSETVY